MFASAADGGLRIPRTTEEEGRRRRRRRMLLTLTEPCDMSYVMYNLSDVSSMYLVPSTSFVENLYM